MNVEETNLPGVLIFRPERYPDDRGFFSEIYREGPYSEHGVEPVVQLNHSRSVRGTLRGLHFQEPTAQGKLVWVVRGAVWDVAVDVRRGSPTFGEWHGMEITADEPCQVWIPKGYAHGFCVLSDEVDFLYGCTDIYSGEHGRAVAWNDPEIGIEWPISDVLLSERDSRAPRLADAPVLPEF